MIGFLYLEHIDPPDRVQPSATNILFSIELYRIVGKYSVPVLGSTALGMFEGQSGHWLRASREMSPPGHELPTSGGFCNIIERVYKLPNADPKHPIMSYILALNYQTQCLRLICSTGRVPLFRLDAFKKVPEFSRGLSPRC
jgi:hypothetical protein